ncbi:MAG: hypothetical protein LBF00_02465 [Mycoplasmataceae bacterium]|nr:hypothetical protein [Mycoplasmataceae bacterium]
MAFVVITITIAYDFKPMSTEFKSVCLLFDQGSFTKYTDTVKFYELDNFDFKDFSMFTIFAAIFKPLFNIQNNFISQYLFWQQVITFSVIFCCAIVGFFYKKINNSKVGLFSIILAIAIFILLFSFLFYETPTNGSCWLSIPILLYCYQMFEQKNRNDNLTNNILLILVLSISALDMDLTLITVLLLIFNVCYTSLKKWNPLGQLLYYLFPFGYVFFAWMPLFSTVPYVVLLVFCLICSIAMILLISLNFFKVAITRISKVLNQHPFFIVIILSIGMYILSFFLTVTLFNYHFSWKLWPDSYDYFWGISLSQHPNFNSYFNITSWIVLLALFIFSIVIFIIKKNSFLTQPYLLLIFLMIFLFINPLSLNVFLKISDQGSYIPFDLGVVNFLIIVPLLLLIGNNISSHQIFSIKNMEIINVRYS